MTTVTIPLCCVHGGLIVNPTDGIVFRGALFAAEVDAQGAPCGGILGDSTQDWKAVCWHGLSTLIRPKDASRADAFPRCLTVKDRS